MNFVFIIDTSISMSQSFDGLSMFDAAKNVIKNFVIKRETDYINNTNINKKNDKYFLLTLNDKLEESLICNWTTTVEHFIYQLNSLKINYDYTSIDSAIKNSLNMLNIFKKVSITGRHFSKIENSYILIFTDGGYIMNNTKRKLKFSDKNFLKSESKLLDEIELPRTKQTQNFPFIYKDILRWDERIFIFILSGFKNNKEKIESYNFFKKLIEIIPGEIHIFDKYDFLNKKLSDLNNNCFISSKKKANIKLYSSLFQKEGGDTIIINIQNGYDLESKINWPLPDETRIKKEDQFIPPKNSLPIYELSNIIKYNFDIPQDFYDEYDIINKPSKEIIIRNLDKFKNFNLSEFLTNFNKNIYMDLSVYFGNHNNINEFFGILIIIPTKKCLEILEKYKKVKSIQIIIFQNIFDLNNNNIDSLFTFKIYNMSYNYNIFNELIINYDISQESNFQVNLEKYFKSIPFYYIDYIKKFLAKKKINITLNEFSSKDYYRKYLSDQVINEYNILNKLDMDQLKEIVKKYAQNKKLHTEHQASCCFKEYLYQNDFEYRTSNNINNNNNNIGNKNNEQDYYNFIYKAFNVDDLKNKNICLKNDAQNNSNNNIIKNNANCVDIEFMGDYREKVFKYERPKDYLIPENEIKKLIKDLFGNQFIERKISYATGINNSNINKLLYTDEISVNNNESQNNVLLKRKRENSMDTISISSKSKLSTDLNESTQSQNSNSMDEEDNKIYESKLSKLLLNEFINSINSINKEQKNQNTIKCKITYKISDEKLYNWKLNQIIKKYSKKIINCLDNEGYNNGLVDVVKDILKESILFPNKSRIKDFINKITELCKDHGVNYLIIKNIRQLIFSK